MITSSLPGNGFARRTLLLSSGALLLSRAALSQGSPPRLIRIIVPYPPGGASDITARLLAQEMMTLLGQSVVVENRGGAASITGTQAVATALPDGSTLGVIDTAFLVNPGLFGTRLPYDTQREFTFISLLVRSPLALFVPAAAPWQNVQQLVAEARAKPGDISFGSAGNGTAVHMAGEQFRQAADFKYLHVPYRGGGPMITEVVAGRIQMAFATIPAISGHVRSGRVRALAITGDTRSTLLPEVPSMAEAGFGQVDAALINGLIGPAGLPDPIVERIAETARQAMSGETTRARLAELGFEPVGSTPRQFHDRALAEITRWEAVVKVGGIQPE